MHDNLPLLENFYQTAFERFEKTRTAPPIAVEFYPYVGLRHTIRLRQGRVFVRLSDLSESAPDAVHESLAFILVAKLLRRQVPKAHAEIYRNYAVQNHVGEQISDARRTRGRKILSGARGAFYDLDEIFARINHGYFQNRLEKPVLSWSRRKTRRVFGHQDAVHNTVIISRTLDDRRVPAFVVEFVLYHELLHIVHPTRVVNGKRRIHTAAFRRDEQKFARAEEAEKWLEKLATRARRRDAGTQRK
jgi:hypothetical protein